MRPTTRSEWRSDLATRACRPSATGAGRSPPPSAFSARSLTGERVHEAGPGGPEAGHVVVARRGLERDRRRRALLLALLVRRAVRLRTALVVDRPGRGLDPLVRIDAVDVVVAQHVHRARRRDDVVDRAR